MSTFTMIVGIVMAAVTMSAIVCNTLVLVVICWNRSIRRPLNVFLFNLAMADVGMTCTCIPYAVGQVAFKNMGLTSTFCHINSFLITLFMMATALIITATCLYQYLMVTGPLENTVSCFQSIIFLMIGWTTALGLAIGPMFKWGKYEIAYSVFGCAYDDVGKVQYYSYNSVLGFMGFLFPLTLLLSCYCSILFAIQDSDTRIAKGWIVASVATDASCIETGKRRIIMASVLIMVSFLLFRTPFLITILLNTLNLVSPQWLNLADQVAFWAVYFQAAVDPFIYGFQHGEYCKTLKEIKETLKRGLLEFCCCRRDIEDGEKRKKHVPSLEKIEEE